MNASRESRSAENYVDPFLEEFNKRDPLKRGRDNEEWKDPFLADLQEREAAKEKKFPPVIVVSRDLNHPEDNRKSIGKKGVKDNTNSETPIAARVKAEQDAASRAGLSPATANRHLPGTAIPLDKMPAPSRSAEQDPVDFFNSTLDSVLANAPQSANSSKPALMPRPKRANAADLKRRLTDTARKSSEKSEEIVAATTMLKQEVDSLKKQLLGNPELQKQVNEDIESLQKLVEGATSREAVAEAQAELADLKGIIELSLRTEIASSDTSKGQAKPSLESAPSQTMRTGETVVADKNNSPITTQPKTIVQDTMRRAPPDLVELPSRAGEISVKKNAVTPELPAKTHSMIVDNEISSSSPRPVVDTTQIVAPVAKSGGWMARLKESKLAKAAALVTALAIGSISDGVGRLFGATEDDAKTKIEARVKNTENPTAPTGIKNAFQPSSLERSASVAQKTLPDQSAGIVVSAESAALEDNLASDNPLLKKWNAEVKKIDGKTVVTIDAKKANASYLKYNEHTLRGLIANTAGFDQRKVGSLQGRAELLYIQDQLQTNYSDLLHINTPSSFTVTDYDQFVSTVHDLAHEALGANLDQVKSAWAPKVSAKNVGKSLNKN